MFGFFRALRRRRLAKRPFPEQWLAHLSHAAFYDELPKDDRVRFLRDLKVFVWQKHFFGAGGLEMTDEIRVLIAASAVRLTLGLNLSYYDRLTEIVVYPSHYKHPDADGSIIYGEAHRFGTVVLSWDAVQHGIANPDDGQDTAMHEFAHVLDVQTGVFDGTPQLRQRSHVRPWAEVMSKHFLQIRDGTRRGKRLLSSYAATNEAEFFAVATEVFFEQPEQLRKKRPDLYAELQRFYGVDPGQPGPRPPL